ncbi:MAG: methyltransferase, partial [Burkholderiales bacterium]|nr:methyltransferase [Burkholderiales bacterium]
VLAAPAAAREQTPDVIFVPTPYEVVDEILRHANVKKGDVLYDLGSGDGRIPVTAAKRFGVRAVGIDIDPQRIKEALYLLPDLNVKLRPRLLNELKPGTRIVSHQFDMGTWQPEKKVELNGRVVYLWTVPERKKQ